MGKQQDWSVTAYVFVFLSVASQIHCTSHLNSIRRVSQSSLGTTTSGVNQQESKEKDLIKKLPGQPPVSFRQYGGYVAVNETTERFFYYYFVEAINASDSTPLVLWLNGGPGCSSLGRGALLENGPFRVHSDGETLFRNPYAYNNEANMLYLESPAKVGFSYANTPEDLMNPSDNKTAEDNYVFLVKWLERFPEYKAREFYIAGQSYAGHYATQLAQIILQRNKQTFINLQGIFLGSPGFDRIVEANSEYTYMAAHNMIPQKYLDDYIDCGIDTPSFDLQKCNDAIAIIEAQKKKVSIYNIYAPECKNATLTKKPKKGTTIMVYDPCSEDYVTAYLNRIKVQEAIHVKSTKLPYAWQHCNWNLSMSWNQDDIDGTVVPVLHEIMGRVRILVYSGDLDMAVPVTGTRQVIKSMNLTIEKSWRQWYSGGELGGFTEEYKGNFTFATVRAAGHSAAIDQPIRALTMFSSFIRHTPLPNTF